MERRCGLGVYTLQGLELWGPCQCGGKSNWMDAQALARLAAPAHHGDKEAHSAPRFGLPLHTGCAAWGAKKVPERLRLTRAIRRCRGLEQTGA